MLVGIAAVICTVCVGTAPSASFETAQAASRCLVSASGPWIENLTVFAVGKFTSCTRRTATATVILQGLVNGKWTRVARVSKQLDMRARKTYTLKTTPIHCSAHPHSEHMRAYVTLRTSPSDVIAVSNLGGSTYCI